MAIDTVTVGSIHLQQERTPLFGFKEPGYDPSAIMASRIAEVATVGFLGAFLAGRFTRVG